MLKSYHIFLIFILLAACQPQVPVNAPATAVPFPTMTVGQQVQGALPPSGAFSDANISSPATAVALVNRPTATPDYTACAPEVSGVTLRETPPDTPQAATDTLVRFLDSGGALEDFQFTLTDEWDALTTDGYLRTDTDLTGEGEAEIILGYTAPGDVGTLLIIGCENGRYVLRYSAFADGIAPPDLVWLDDINRDGLNDLVVSLRVCADPDACEFQTLLLTWNAQSARFVNMLDGVVRTLQLPDVRDMDGDDVVELVVNLESFGNTATGPLQTGVNIYDWDGEVYTLSIVQYDAPRYRIQYVHAADRLFLQQEMAAAIELYQQAIATDGLRYWFNDGPVTVISYALYRMLLAYAYLGDDANLEATRLRLQGVSTGEPSVYVTLGNAFTNAINAGGDLFDGCAAVRDLLADDDTALNLLNRYGSRNPKYTALELCPY